MQTKTKQFWTFGGGRGGVGKSVLTAYMGAALARMGKSVVAVDADPGAANLHTYLGIKSPTHTLVDALEGRSTCEEALLETPECGLRLLSCAGDILGIANPVVGNKERIIEFISKIRADYILVDVGTETSSTVLDFFNMSDEGIVIVSPDPASMQNAFGFIKSAVHRKIQRKYGYHEGVVQALKQFRETSQSSKPFTMMDFYDALCRTDPEVAENIASLVDEYRPLMVINMANTDQDQRTAEILQSAAKKFLNVDVLFCGLILADPVIQKAVQDLQLLDLDDPQSHAARQIRETVQRLVNRSSCERMEGEAATVEAGPATPVIGLNDNLMFMGKELHIQTEDLGYTGRRITTEVFYDGRIIHSVKSEYPAVVRDSKARAPVIELMRKQHYETIREIQRGNIQFPNPA